MEGLNQRIIIVGCGPGSRDYVLPVVGELVGRARVLAGAPRLLDLFPVTEAAVIALGKQVPDWLEALASRKESPIVVLVSGDPGISSLAARVLERFGRASCRVVPGISSVQLACAALGLDWSRAQIINAHGSVPTSVPGNLLERDPWLVLMGAVGAQEFAAELANLQSRHCFVCEDLGFKTERVRAVTAGELLGLSRHPRRVVVFTREVTDGGP